MTASVVDWGPARRGFTQRERLQEARPKSPTDPSPRRRRRRHQHTRHDAVPDPQCLHECQRQFAWQCSQQCANRAEEAPRRGRSRARMGGAGGPLALPQGSHTPSGRKSRVTRPPNLHTESPAATRGTGRAGAALRGRKAETLLQPAGWAAAAPGTPRALLPTRILAHGTCWRKKRQTENQRRTSTRFAASASLCQAEQCWHCAMTCGRRMLACRVRVARTRTGWHLTPRCRPHRLQLHEVHGSHGHKHDSSTGAQGVGRERERAPEAGSPCPAPRLRD